MSSITQGQSAPDFCLPDGDENRICLKDYQGKWLILYFYPKDNTPGCTLEAVEFTRELASIRRAGAEVVGISPDSPKSHCKFRDKHDLAITLLSDKDHGVLEAYGVWALKKLAGHEYHGVVRSTFLIDPHGRIAQIWRKVKVSGHVREVMDALVQHGG